MSEIIQYVRFNSVPENLKTKTQLKEMRLKPLNEQKPDAYVKAYLQGRWKILNLYDTSKTKEIKKRIVKDVSMTDENIAEALYVINKSAKKSRDTKTLNYEFNKHDIVSHAKKRQNELYDLKSAVITKLIQENKVVVKGYHKQIFNNNTSYIKLIEFCGRTFHIPISKFDVVDLNFLGEIEDVITADAVKTKIKFNEAYNLLCRYSGYVKQKKEEIIYDFTEEGNIQLDEII